MKGETLLLLLASSSWCFKYSIKYCKTSDKAARAGRNRFIWEYGLLVENNVQHWLKREVQCGVGFGFCERFLKPL